jgi:hypothetical protein
MQELIETIRAAVATDASAEKKAAGINACRTILTALDTEPGKPLAMPHVLPPPTMPGATPRLPVSQLSLDQMLDLMIARLTMVANAADTNQQLPAPPPTPTAIAPLAAPSASRGMRVPMAAPNIGKATPRPATRARPVPPRKP